MAIVSAEVLLQNITLVLKGTNFDREYIETLGKFG